MPSDPPAETHAGLPVEGYAAQSDANVKLVNYHKAWEERVLRHLDWLAKQPNLDKRWLTIGRTGIEKSFMAINRAVFQPGRIALPEDKLDGLAENQQPWKPDAETKPNA